MEFDPSNNMIDRLMIVIMVFCFWPIPSIPVLFFMLIQALRGKL